MAIFTGTLSAQNTSVKLCTVKKPREYSSWFASVLVSGTFGSGTVTLQVSIDGGVTKVPLVQDGTASVASATAAGVINLRCGVADKLAENIDIYASIATATNPAVAITVIDNN